MKMKHKVVFKDLGWYEVDAESKAEAEDIALTAAKSFHPELPDSKLVIERTEMMKNG